jgi:hypothetical protein
VSFYERESEVKRAFFANHPMILLVYKESYLNLDETNQSLPSLAVSLLQEFEDVFQRRCLMSCHPLEALNTRLILCPKLLFQTDQPIGVIQRKQRSFKGKLRI